MSSGVAPSARSLLWVDDEIDAQDPSIQLLSSFGFAVDVANDATQGLALLRGGRHHGLILDLALPDLSGLELLKELRRSQIVTPAVVLTGYGTLRSAVEAMRLGALDVLEKPLIGEGLLSLATRLILRSAYDPGIELRALCARLRASNEADLPRLLARSLVSERSGWFPCWLELARLAPVVSSSRHWDIDSLEARCAAVQEIGPAATDLCLALEQCHVPDWASALETVSARHSLSNRRFREILRRELGYTWRQVVALLRTRSCLVRLVREREHIRQIAFSAGYAHASEFSRDCARILGVPPSEFRNLVTRS